MTTKCKKYCYVNRHHFNYKNVINKYTSNYKQSQLDTFTERIITELKLQQFAGINRFRIHVSGDFYNQEYVNNWYKIIRKFPGISFTAYTRSYQLDFRYKPKNLHLFYSIDDSTKFYNPTIKRRAYVVKRDQYTPCQDNSYTCKSECFKCKACFVPAKKNVLFIQH